MSKSGEYFIYGMALILWVVFVDQYTKWIIIETTLRIDGDFLPFKTWFLTPDRLEYFFTEREVFSSYSVTSFMNLVMVWNQGISFGMFDNNEPIFSYMFASISMIVAFFMIIWLALTRYFLLSMAIGLVAGGAIGNTIDRIRFGAVADFIDLHYNGYHWPAFNVADACITIGASIMVYMILFMTEDTQTTVDI